MEDETKFTDYTLDRCFAVNCLNITDKVMQTPCADLQHPLCVKTKQHQGTVCQARTLSKLLLIYH